MTQKGKSPEISQAGKVLIVEPQAEMSQRYPWDGRAKRRFQLNEAEVDALEYGAVLWHGSTAFMVEQLA